MAVKLFRDAKLGYGLQTEAADELTFRQEFVAALAALVESNAYKGEWPLALHRWLGQFADICHSYQGYKPQTVETRVLYTAGGDDVTRTVPVAAHVVVPVDAPPDPVPPVQPGGGRRE